MKQWNQEEKVKPFNALKTWRSIITNWVKFLTLPDTWSQTTSFTVPHYAKGAFKTVPLLRHLENSPWLPCFDTKMYNKTHGKWILLLQKLRYDYDTSAPHESSITQSSTKPHIIRSLTKRHSYLNPTTHGHLWT